MPEPSGRSKVYLGRSGVRAVRCSTPYDVPKKHADLVLFFSAVSDDIDALTGTLSIGFTDRAEARQKEIDRKWQEAKDAKRKQRSKRSKKTDDVMGREPALLQAEEKRIFTESILRQATLEALATEYDRRGPLRVTLDTLKIVGWDLITSGGAYTFPHSDANGFATWMSMRSGAKIWGIRRFPELSVPNATSVHKVERLHKSLLNGGEEVVGSERGTLYVQVLEKGSVL